MGINIVLGLQWGDEGKGKVIDLLSKDVEGVVRAQGGNNAGHSVVFQGKEYSFHLIPSGILYPNVQCFLGSGTVIDLEGLVQEVEGLANKGVEFAGRFWISPFAHLVFEYHKITDAFQEQAKGGLSIGTTRRGIGPAYMDRCGRTGVRVCDLISETRCRQSFKFAFERMNQDLILRFGYKELSEKNFIDKNMSLAEKIRPYIKYFEESFYKQNKTILLEGAQGAMLDLIFGTYPYVTSSNTTSSGICLGAGVSPCHINKVLGIAKAYTTRVGEGPFPTEIKEGECNNFDHQVAREFGVTTGRKRRIGWFDAVLVKYAIELNGVKELALTKLDILDTFDKIKICVGYKTRNGELKQGTFWPGELDRMDPIYEELDGWKCSTQGITRYDKLPLKARAYIKRIEELTKVRVKIISTGPSREQTIMEDFQW